MPPVNTRTLAITTLVMASSLAGCAAGLEDDAGADEQDVRTEYVHIMDFAATDQGAWYDLIRKLNTEFTDACGATGCGTHYARITPLTFSCAVSSKRGSVHDCAWTFTTVKTGVDSANAVIGVDAPIFECHVHPRMTAPNLIALLQASEPAIDEPLPGMDGSIRDTLADCFTHPIGSTEVAVATSPTPTYVAATDYYTSTSAKGRWQAAETALVAGFDRVCGDTFCSSDYNDLQALQLQCAITKSTGNVKSCAWVFGGSFAMVSTAGAVVETAHTYRCPIAVHGTLSQLIDTLTAPGSTDAIRRPLPGVTSTAYDGLLGCLP